MISLRAMTQTEFDAYLVSEIPIYAQEKVRAGNWKAEEALAKSQEEFARLLPQGFATPYQHFFVIEVDGEAAGRIWLSSEPKLAGGAGFICDLFVAQEFRRRGVATTAMQLLEDVATDLGLTALALHVFGYNTQARALYAKLGYEITNLNMTKALRPADV
ncbi:MAG: GNAT family N-acetyltransferase [Caldilineaceae bacterium]|nr:GNAT family N-acetyltransferase [Caldilineaceae bacterium]